jgi:hypothetical protein
MEHAMHKTAFAVMVFTLAACATATTPEERAEAEKVALFEDDPRRGAEVDKVCFSRTIDGFTNTTNRAVVISEGTKEYLVTTRSRCTDLDDAMSLAVDSFSSCLTRGDRLIGKDSVFGYNTAGTPSFPCHVDKIYEWDRKAKDESSESEADSSEG